MKHLYDEVTRRFPESVSFLGNENEDLPYLVMGSIVVWLCKLSSQEINEVLISRIIEFKNWCVAQPRGDDAGDDIITIYTVAFLEELFQHEPTRKIIPHLQSKEELLRGQDYLIRWVGKENFANVLLRY